MLYSIHIKFAIILLSIYILSIREKMLIDGSYRI